MEAMDVMETRDATGTALDGAVEKPLTPRGIAERYGYAEAEVRAWCRRARNRHPLPHVRCGEKRPVYKIRPSVFEAWRDEEEGSPR